MASRPVFLAFKFLDALLLQEEGTGKRRHDLSLEMRQIQWWKSLSPKDPQFTGWKTLTLPFNAEMTIFCCL